MSKSVFYNLFAIKLIRIYIFFASIFISYMAQAQGNGTSIYNPIFTESFTGCSSQTFTTPGNNEYYNGVDYFNHKVYYQFYWDATATVNISLCSSTFNTTVTLFDWNENLVTSANLSGCGSQSTLALSNSGNHPSGYYYIEVTGQNNTYGDYTLSLSTPSTPVVATDLSNPMDVGIVNPCEGLNFTHSLDNTLPCRINAIGGEGKDIFYKFTLTETANVTLSNCGSFVNTTLHLLNTWGSIITSHTNSEMDNSPCNNSYINSTLAAGTYYVVSENYGYNGIITTNISVNSNSLNGATADNAIYAGTFNGAGTFTSTLNNGSCYGNDMGQPSNDIYYQFTLTNPATVTLSHGGSGFNTYMHLLNSAQGFIASNNTHSGSGFTNGEAYIKTSLSPGTYYVVSEGIGSLTGNITTQIQVEPPPLPGISPSQDQNYVLTLTPRIAGYTLDPFVRAGTADANNVMADIQYLDGLGRPIQNVQVKGNEAANKDIVVPIAYDQYGREVRQYLPYASSSNNGSYKTGALTEQQSFYQSTPGNGVVQTPTPYAEAVYEASPLNRVTEQGAPGDAWQPVANSKAGHTQKIEYWNNGTDEVKLWKVTANGAIGSSNYGAGELFKTITKDENWKETDLKAGTKEEFKDKKERVVLKRNWETDIKSLSTYYVYDDMGNLRYVLPPAVNENGNSTLSSFTESDAACINYIYVYHYDGRKRLIEKRIPGKGWEHMVYNPLDQLVLSQDSVQRASNRWLFNKYDGLGRLIITGMCNDADSRTSLQNTIDAEFSNNTAIWEQKTTTGVGYTNDAYPRTITTYHQISYYDDYDFPDNIFGVPTIAFQSTRTKGLLTGTKTNILGSTSMLLSVNFYDDNGRMIQNKSQNRMAGIDVVDYAYSFTNEILSSTRTHIAPNATTTTISSSYTYDHMGRKKQIKKSINGAPETIISAMEYNEMGQPVTKALHNGLQSNSYRYNERGWLKSQNSPQFSMKLNYQDSTVKQYNGNIAYQAFTNGGSLQTFNYTYDKLNRLTKGQVSSNLLSEIMTYDVMGNIKSLNRDGTGAKTYNYLNGGNSNQLESVPNLTVTTYIYDGNGNATRDGNNLKTITYNYLNLPETVSGGISYTYDATGKKLMKIHAGNGSTEYIDGIQYRYGVIDFIQTEEGIARNNGGVYSYEYNITDHLGNVRASFYQNPVTNNLQVLQRDDYYAFGKRKSVPIQLPSGVISTNNKYLYNGKEVQDELSGQYDYGARFYDPVIGRWNVVDPLAEKFGSLSPYNYTDNNPVNNIDPDGMDIIYGGGQFGGDLLNGADALQFFKDLKASKAGEKKEEEYEANWNDDESIWDCQNCGEKDGDKRKSFEDEKNRISIHKWEDKPLTHAQELAKYGQIISASNVSFGASFVAGGIVEYGVVMTNKNWAQRYTTVYYAHGFNPPSIAGGVVFISSKPNQRAVFSDWKGAMGGLSGSIGYVSGSIGFAPAYNAYGVAATYGRPFSLVKEASSSGTYNIGVTTLIGAPFLMKANFTDTYIKRQTYLGGQ